MPQLTAAILDQALAQCRSWADDGLVLDVSVNISPTDLADENFSAHVAAGLTRHRLPSTRLVLEVTESLLMADRERAVRVLERLRSTGVGISIDDYGTGYSSLAYLASLPVSELKLDCDLVQGYHLSRPLPPSQLEAWLRDRSPAEHAVPVG
jgi:EAL domain-containing protein (putative c-di-GMP-specific phosphodiesterase class I)